MTSIVHSVENFAVQLFDLYPVESGTGRGFWGLRVSTSPNKLSAAGRYQAVRFHVSHEYMIRLYSAANRLLRDKGFDSTLLLKTVEKGHVLRFQRDVEGQYLMRYVTLNEDNKHLYEIPLTGGKW